MTTTVWLVLFLVLPGGAVVPGSEADGWAPRLQPGPTVCAARAKHVEASTPPPGIVRIIARCELRDG